MKMFPDRDTFQLKQVHMTINQPIRIVFRARETADGSYYARFTLQYAVAGSKAH